RDARANCFLTGTTCTLIEDQAKREGDRQMNTRGHFSESLNQTTPHWHTFRVARAVRVSPQPLSFVRIAHATREGWCKTWTNIMSLDLVLLLGVAVLLSACSTTVNWNYQRTPSTAFTQPQTTTVGALFQEAADHHPGLSGFALVRQGGPA